MHAALRVIAPLVLLSLLCVGAALATGSVAIPFTDVLHALAGNATEPVRSIVLELRLPRVVAGFAVGALLAVSGALLQILLRNPLADPYVLGTSGGAAVGALLVILVGLSARWLNAAAFLGALFATVLVFGISRRDGDWSPTRLLLSGVILAAGWGALIAFILTIAPEHNLRGMLFWLMGDLAVGGKPWPALLILLIVLAVGMALARPLNVLVHGEIQARTLGVAVTPVRNTLYVLAALATAGAVTLAGSVGFVGLVVPHMLRLAGIRDHRLLLPACALSGGTLIVIADLCARTLWAPQQLPVGILTAALGIPVFLFLLLRRQPEIHT